MNSDYIIVENVNSPPKVNPNHDRLKLISAVILIQRVFKGYLTRKRMIAMEIENMAAIVIQTNFRAIKSHRWTNECIVTRNVAALIIQRNIRGFLSRKSLDHLLVQRNVAAYVIQQAMQRFLLFRMSQGSKVVQISPVQTKFILSCEQRAIVIPSPTNFRIWSFREQAAIVIQSFFRQILAQRFVEYLREDREIAALIIQRNFRKYKGITPRAEKPFPKRKQRLRSTPKKLSIKKQRTTPRRKLGKRSPQKRKRKRKRSPTKKKRSPKRQSPSKKKLSPTKKKTISSRSSVFITLKDLIYRKKSRIKGEILTIDELMAKHMQ